MIPLPEDVRVLLVRTSALGDVVHCLPVLGALRRHRPRARIAWVVEAAIAPVLEGHPDLDQVIEARLRPWRHAALSRGVRDEVHAFLAALRDFAPDVALDLMGNHKGALIARASGAPRVVGAARPWRREPSSALWITEPLPLAPPPAGSREPAPGEASRQPLREVAVAPPPHAVDRALALAAALGVPIAGAGFDRDRAARAPEGDGGAATSGGPGYALIHPGAGWGNKRYPPERWGSVARRLADRTGLPTRVPVAPGEEPLATATVAAAAGAAVAVPAPDLAALVRELVGARLVLAGDTGPLHLAHALGVPVLAVMGPTDPRRHGPYGAPERALWRELPCSFCYKSFAETKACLWAVPVEAIVERAVRLLAPGGNREAAAGRATARR